jgi:hypothetical protein
MNSLGRSASAHLPITADPVLLAWTDPILIRFPMSTDRTADASANPREDT